MEGGGWRVEGGGWRVEGGGLRVEGGTRVLSLVDVARLVRRKARGRSSVALVLDPLIVGVPLEGRATSCF